MAKAQSRTQQDNKNKTANVFIGLLLLAVGGFFVWKLPCPSSTQYIYFKLVISLAAGLISAIMLGFIRLNIVNYISAGGGIAVFILMLRYTPDLIDTKDKCAGQWDITFILKDSANTSIEGLTGSMDMILGTDVRNEKISEKGVVTFKNVPIAFSGQTVPVEVKAAGWWFIESNKKTQQIALSKNTFILPLKQDESECCVEGTVRKMDNNGPLDSAIVSLQDMSVVTKADGKYSFYIAAHKRAASQVVTVQRRGYKENTLPVSPKLKQRWDLLMEKE